MALVGSKRRNSSILILCVFLLVLNGLVVSYQPVDKNPPIQRLEDLSPRDEFLLGQSYKVQYNIAQPLRAFLFKQSCHEWTGTVFYPSWRKALGNLTIATSLIGMFYIFYRLSRTGVDDFFPNSGVFD